MSYKYYQNTLDNSIQYRLKMLDIDKDISPHRRNSCKDELRQMEERVYKIVQTRDSDENKVKALQQCIFKMNLEQIGVP